MNVQVLRLAMFFFIYHPSYASDISLRDIAAGVGAGILVTVGAVKLEKWKRGQKNIQPFMHGIMIDEQIVSKENKEIQTDQLVLIDEEVNLQENETSIVDDSELSLQEELISRMEKFDNLKKSINNLKRNSYMLDRKREELERILRDPHRDARLKDPQWDGFITAISNISIFLKSNSSQL